MSSIANIFILTNTLKLGGAEKQSIYLANALKNNYKVLLIVYYGNQLDLKLIKLTEKYKIDVIYLNGSHFSKFIKLFLIFIKNRNSVIFSYLATTNFLNAILGFISFTKYKVGGIRSMKINKSKFYIQRFLHNFFLDKSIFNNSVGYNEFTSKGFSEKKSLVIPNCIEITQENKKHLYKNDTVNIITVARFVYQKDLITAILSIKELHEIYIENKLKINFKYTIIGYGELEQELRREIKIHRLENIINVLINPEDLNQFLYDSNIYLSTSIIEGLSNSIMEAMEYSLPIIGTNVGDNDKLIKHGINGYLVKIKDSKLIAEHLFELINDKIKIDEMGRNSLNILIENFSMSKFKKNYISLIENIR